MAYTQFGEFVRILRIKHHEVMGDLARVLDVKLPFLSAVENGKKNVPVEWIPKIVAHYNLNALEEADLLRAVEESKIQVRISTGGAGMTQRRAALQFARSFDNMDDETALKILELLSKKGAE